MATGFMTPEQREKVLKKRMLTAKVMDMSEDELRIALLCVVQGGDVDYAIDTAYHRFPGTPCHQQGQDLLEGRGSGHH